MADPPVTTGIAICKNLGANIMNTHVKTVIIPAGGKGTRLMPATKVTAKELLPVYDKVAIDFAIEEASGVGAERIIVVVNASKESAIRDYLSPHGGAGIPKATFGKPTPEIVYVNQDKALGLGHAILCCRDLTLAGPFGVILPDDLILGENCLAEMAVHFDQGNMVAAMQVTAEQTTQYGIFRLSGLPNRRIIPVSGMVEKPALGTAPSCIAAVGRYILDPMIFDILAHTPFGAGGELQLTDAIAIAANALPLSAFQFSGLRYDCGQRDGLLAAAVARQAFVKGQDLRRALPRSVSLSSASA